MPDNTRGRLVRDIVREQHISPTKWNIPPNKQPDSKYTEGYKQGRFDAEMDRLNTEQPEAWESEELEDIINDVKRGIKDSVHIHNFLRQTLTSQRASDVRRLEMEKIDIPSRHRQLIGVTKSTRRKHTRIATGYNQAIDQAIALLKDNK